MGVWNIDCTENGFYEFILTKWRYDCQKSLVKPSWIQQHRPQRNVICGSIHYLNILLWCMMNLFHQS